MYVSNCHWVLYYILLLSYSAAKQVIQLGPTREFTFPELELFVMCWCLDKAAL